MENKTLEFTGVGTYYSIDKPYLPNPFKKIKLIDFNLNFLMKKMKISYS